MKYLYRLFVFLAVVTVGLQQVIAVETQLVHPILTSKGDQLFAGDKPFRFISFNIPNLHLIEDNFSFTDPNPWRWPNEFEIADALESVRQMGGTVVRIYVLSVRREGSDMGDYVHVFGPGKFNEEAFRVLDKVLQIAGEKGIRVIIPLVDNWKWWGGIAEYAQFRGKPPEAFWTDEQVICDFEETIRFTLSRVNSYTGIPYKVDPAIFGWETGNELDSTPEWTCRIAATVKSLDPNHLVIDGYSLHGVREESLADPNVDVITTHHYPNTDSGFVKPILKAHAMTKGKKPYFVGEFGFVPTEEIEEVFKTVIDEDISGALLWSLRFHNRDGGFYWHSEPAGGDKFKAYHWPGFLSGDGYDETKVLNSTLRNASRIHGLESSLSAAPASAFLLPIEHPGRISWRGAAGATSYDVERAVSEEGPWQPIGENISDAAVQYRPLFCDTSFERGQDYYYRVIAKNSGSNSLPSNVVGPVSANHKLLVDEMKDESLIYAVEGAVEERTDHARQTQEDIHRLEIGPGGLIVYRLPQAIGHVRAFLFCNSPHPPCEIALSTDGTTFKTVEAKRQATPRDTGNYGYMQPVLLEASGEQEDAMYVRLSNTSPEDNKAAKADQQRFQVSRIEIDYGIEDNLP